MTFVLKQCVHVAIICSLKSSNLYPQTWIWQTKDDSSGESLSVEVEGFEPSGLRDDARDSSFGPVDIQSVLEQTGARGSSVRVFNQPGTGPAEEPLDYPTGDGGFQPFVPGECFYSSPCRANFPDQIYIYSEV